MTTFPQETLRTPKGENFKSWSIPNNSHYMKLAENLQHYFISASIFLYADQFKVSYPLFVPVSTSSTPRTPSPSVSSPDF